MIWVHSPSKISEFEEKNVDHHKIAISAVSSMFPYATPTSCKSKVSFFL